MHANRRTLTYSSLVVAMAVVLSVALLQLTQTTAKSAAPAAPLAVPVPDNGNYATLYISKTVVPEAGGAPSTDWEFTIVGTGIYSVVTMPAGRRHDVCGFALVSRRLHRHRNHEGWILDLLFRLHRG